MSKKISQAGLQLIKNFEGCRLTAYKPVPWEKYWTIGWGHYGADVKQGQTITQAQADKMLIEDMGRYESFVNNPAYVPLTAQLNQNQFDALVSFCYNCGQGSLKTLCQKGRTLAQIAAKIPEYNKAGGNVLNGLVRRRKAEQDLFNKAVTKVSEPTKEYTLSVANATYAIEYLQKAWEQSATQEEKDRIGRIADNLREASGQPRQNS